MKGVFVAVLLCLVIAESFGLECYQCLVATQECTVKDAALIKCLQCSRQVKKVFSGSTVSEKAIRKCVIPDSKGQVPCPNDYECTNCNTDGCNSASLAKLTWVGFVGVLCALYGK